MRSQAEVLSSQDRPIEGRLNKLESRLDVKMSKLISLRGILSRGARNRLGEPRLGGGVEKRQIMYCEREL